MINLRQVFRSILRDRLNTLVIIISLAVGMASFNLIIMFITRELNTDSFQKYKEQIYALKLDDPWIPGKQMYYCKYGSAEYMKENFPQVEDMCRITNWTSQKIKVKNIEYKDQPIIIAASKNFFGFFSYRLLTNNPSTALEAKNDIVISEDLAMKYFGAGDPIGQVIDVLRRNKNEKMVVTGIFKKPVENSQIVFDMVCPIGEDDSRAYIRLKKGTDREEMEKLFAEKKESIPIINTGVQGQYFLEPFNEAYFDTTRGSAYEVSRAKTDIYIALIIGLMIIGIASFNYLGILTNKYREKIKEYYVRRINGSSLIRLIARFMLENSIMVVISFLLSLYLMSELFPFFNSLTGSTINISFILQSTQVIILAGILILILIITFLFVSYLVWSNLNLKFLKTEQSQKLRSIQIPAFNIFQIASSIGLIICSMIIIKQMNFITNKPIGLDKEVIEIKLPAQHVDKAGVFKEELLKSSTINNVSVVSASPVLEHFLVALKYQQDGVEKEYSPAGFSGDENFLKVSGIQLIEGEDFSETLSSNKKKCLINKSFASLFPDQDLIGKGIPGMEDMIIIGVVKDFHYSDLKSYVEPAFISFDNHGGHLLVKASKNQLVQARKTISQVWNRLIPDYPVNIESVGDRFDWMHRENKNYLKLIISCSFISLFLSMIGLFAISFQRSRSRTKEIGIRKINGAKIGDIITLINKDFIRWVATAFFVALPVSWYAMHKWLENYAYRTHVSWWVYLIAGLIVLFIAILTVSWQSWKASTANPVEALRYE
jgi:putative ABC transport system permease protein